MIYYNINSYNINFQFEPSFLKEAFHTNLKLNYFF